MPHRSPCVMEDDVLVSKGAEVAESMLLRARIEEGARVRGSIIGPDCVVEKGGRS